MQIPQERLEKFKEIYRKRLGKELTEQEAYEKASKLIQLLLVIDKPMTEEEYKDAKALIKHLDKG